MIIDIIGIVVIIIDYCGESCVEFVVRCLYDVEVVLHIVYQIYVDVWIVAVSDKFYEVVVKYRVAIIDENGVWL